MKDYERNLQRFSDMEDVEVSEDDPDVRGWDVVTRDGHDIGEVKDLLVDTSSMKVRCLEVELDGSHFKWNDNRRVAIPLESVQLDEEHDDVVLNGMALDEVARLDEYRPEAGLRSDSSFTESASRDIRGSDPSRDIRGSGSEVREPVEPRRERVRMERFDEEKPGRVLDEGDDPLERRR